MIESYVTSFSGLFTQRHEGAPSVTRIEVTIIQRDYAQGRPGPAVGRIRRNFLAVLQTALEGGEAVNLDFVYGGVDAGTLRPLDGQQRLTTLFLLHWYLAARTGRLGEDQAWKQFSYATRPSARLFCERLVQHSPPDDCETYSEWLQDQAWYQYTWSHDPTIQSMLVVIDDIDALLAAMDHEAAWERLMSIDDPAIAFHLLPMKATETDADRYIKMNSRGKPLTEFENFKARFEHLLSRSCPERATEFAAKVDGVWTDVFWRYHGGDYLIDDEFLRYFTYVTELIEWRRGRVLEGDLHDFAERIYGPGNPEAAENLNFLMDALDIWVGCDVTGDFAELLSLEVDESQPPRVRLFNAGDSGTNLFEECCRQYGEGRGRNRTFSLAQSLMLYSVIWHRMRNTDEPKRRLRIIRNLIEASSNEVRLDRMDDLLAAIETVMESGSVAEVPAFNQLQVADEQRKAVVLSASPGIACAAFALEDEPLLRGALTVFDLDANRLEQRANAFRELFANRDNWRDVAGALLSCGDYWRQLNTRFFQFGSHTAPGPWRELFTNGKQVARARGPLMRLLDAYNAGSGTRLDRLQTISEAWLRDADAERRFDWRYYFVKYRVMRHSASGRYVGHAGTLGYQVCMLSKTKMNSWYRDAYLTAVYHGCEIPKLFDEPWFKGFESLERWLRFKRGKIGVRSVDDGWQFDVPSRATRGWDEVATEFGVGEDCLLRIPQAEVSGVFVDTVDRVQLAIRVLERLVEVRG